ncbi:MAG: hypothetical protein FWD14_07245 [Treponema sp.]|nr:hypothetical protein [Treponema sp.]
MYLKRKLFACIIFVMMVVSVNTIYTQEAKQNYLNFGASGLLAVSDGGASPGVGAAVSWVFPRLFLDSFGFGIHFNLLVPFVENNAGSTNIGLAQSFLLGPSAIVFENDVFSVPVTIGYNFNHVHVMKDAGLNFELIPDYENTSVL